MARQSGKDLLERVFYAATRVTDLGRNLSDQEIRNRLSAFTGVHYRANCVQFHTDRVLIRAYRKDVGIMTENFEATSLELLSDIQV